MGVNKKVYFAYMYVQKCKTSGGKFFRDLSLKDQKLISK